MLVFKAACKLTAVRLGWIFFPFNFFSSFFQIFAKIDIDKDYMLFERSIHLMISNCKMPQVLHPDSKEHRAILAKRHFLIPIRRTPQLHRASCPVVLRLTNKAPSLTWTISQEWVPVPFSKSTFEGPFVRMLKSTCKLGQTANSEIILFVIQVT